MKVCDDEPDKNDRSRSIKASLEDRTIIGNQFYMSHIKFVKKSQIMLISITHSSSSPRSSDRILSRSMAAVREGMRGDSRFVRVESTQIGLLHFLLGTFQVNEDFSRFRNLNSRMG